MERLSELLLEWEDRKSAGETLRAEDLCPGDTVLARQLSEQIRLLESFDLLIAEVASEEPAPQKLGKYLVRGTLGRGGMGVVYLAHDPDLRRNVAIKALHAVSFEAERLRLRFEREGHLLARLENDHIVGVYDAGVDEGRPYLVMEYFPAGSLADHRSRFVEEGPEEAVRLLTKIITGVQHAHDQGVLHRDLKPGNILLDAADEPLVADVGIAALSAAEPAEDAGSPAPEGLTAHGSRPGTLAYMAPEQVDPAVGPISPRTDVWALGVIFFELLTGRRPFNEQSLHDYPDRERRPVWTVSERRRISRGIRRVAEGCLRWNPDDRFGSARAVAHALASLEKRRRVLKWTGFGVFLLLVAGALAAVGYRESRPERQYDRNVRPALALLRQGKRVDLIPENGLPPFFIREGGKFMTVRRTEDGMEIDSPGVGIVELLPQLPSAGHVVTAEIRHDHSRHKHDIFSGVGIANAAFHAENALGRQHLLRLAVLDAFAGLTHIHACLYSNWILERPGDNIPLNSEFRHFDGCQKLPAEGLPEPRWASITLRTVDQDSTAWFRSGGRSAKPMTCDEEIYLSHVGVLNEEQPAAAGVEYPAKAPSSLSLYVQGGRLTVRQISVIPLD